MDTSQQNQNPENPSSGTSEGSSPPPPSPESPIQEAPIQTKRSHKRKMTGPSFKKTPAGARPSSPGANVAPPESPQSGNGSSKESFKNPFTKSGYTAEQKKAMREKIAMGAGIASHVVASRIVTDPLEQERQLFVMTEKQTQNVAKPVVSILSRHEMGSEVLGDSDLSDYIMLGVAIVGYVIANIQERAALAQARAQMHAFEPETQQQEPARASKSQEENAPLASTQSPKGDSLMGYLENVLGTPGA